MATVYASIYIQQFQTVALLKPFCATPLTPSTPLLQVANHIQKVAGPYVYTGSDEAGLSDPFTGAGRYVPGTAGRQQYFGSGTDPFTGKGPRRDHEVHFVTCHILSSVWALIVHCCRHLYRHDHDVM